MLVSEHGGRSVFRLAPDGSIVAGPGVRTELRRLDDGFQAHRRDGSVLRFDAGGRLTSITDRLGSQLTVERDGSRITVVTGASGQQLRFTYDGDRLTEVATDDGRRTAYGYDDRGRLTSVTDPLGGTTRYAYDDGDRVTEVTDANGDQVVVSTYDAEGRVVEQLEGGTDRWRFEYEDDGDIRVTTVTAPDGGSRTYRYERRSLVSVTDALGHEVTMTYDRDLNLASFTDAMGRTTTFEHDAAGEVTLVQPPAPFAPQRFEYDRDGNLVAVTDAAGATTRYGYDEHGSVTSITDPTGEVTRLHYGEVPGVPSRVELPGDRAWTYRYDDHGHLVEQRSPEGRALALGYDDQGNVDRIAQLGDDTDPTWTMTWNDAGWLTASTDPTGATTSYVYDQVGQIASIEDPAGRRTAYTYDALYRLTEVTSADEATTAYEYDGGRLVARVAPTGARTDFDHDAVGRLVSVTGPDGAVWSYGYDPVGNLIEVEEPTGTVTRTTFNAFGSPETIHTAGEEPVEVAYDAAGRITAMLDELGEQTYEYDDAGRLTGIARDGRTTHAYRYDEVGNLVSRSVDPLAEVRFTYDLDGLPVTITSGELDITQRFDDAGRLVEREDGRGVTTAFAYDAASRLSTIHAQDVDGRTVDVQRYAYDVAGLPVRHNTVADETTYDYDALGRLTAATTVARGTGEVLEQLGYGYDDAGRRTSLTSVAGTTSYRYDDADRLISSDGPDGEVAYGYDPAGNRTRAGDVELEFGPLGRLAAVTDADGVRTEHVHDGAGVRVRSESSDGTTLDHVWDLAAPNYPLLATAGPDGLEAYVTSADGEVLAATPTDSRRPSTVHTDALGSITALSDVDGHRSAAVTYDPFGDVRHATGDAPPLAIGFTGEHTDPSTGLVHLRLRDYDPSVGQFTALDPAPAPTAAPYTTPYHYAYNAPTVHTDPSGACPWCVVTAAVGGVVNAGLEVGGSLIRGEEVKLGNVAGAFVEGAIVGGLAGTGVGLVGVAAIGVGANAANQATRHTINGTWSEFNPVSGAAELALAGGLAAAGGAVMRSLTTPTVTTSGFQVSGPSLDVNNAAQMFRWNTGLNTNLAFRQQVLMMPVNELTGSSKR